MAYYRCGGGVPSSVKTLPTYKTASGSVATFETDMTENLVEVKCQIVAKQASGTPSPDNPLPIGVYDSLTLYHNDINLWDEQWELGIINSTTGENEPSTTAYRSKNYIPVKPNMQIYIVKPLINLGLRFYDINKNFISPLVVYVNYNITIPADCYYVRFHNTSTPTYANDISFNYPNTETAYHAFNGAYIPFGQTVANGVLDITTGKLRMTHVDVDLGSLNLGWDIYAYGASNTFYAIFNDKADGLSNFICSQYDNYSGGVAQMPDLTIRGQANSKTLFIRNTNYSDVPTFKSSLSGVQLVYELATPIEIQLDSKTITALLNENNIWCDTGDISAKYILSVGEALRQA